MGCHVRVCLRAQTPGWRPAAPLGGRRALWPGRQAVSPEAARAAQPFSCRGADGPAPEGWFHGRAGWVIPPARPWLHTPTGHQPCPPALSAYFGPAGWSSAGV